VLRGTGTGVICGPGERGRLPPRIRNPESLSRATLHHYRPRRRGRVVLVSCDSERIHLPIECWKPLVEPYVGSRS